MNKFRSYICLSLFCTIKCTHALWQFFFSPEFTLIPQNEWIWTKQRSKSGKNHLTLVEEHPDIPGTNLEQESLVLKLQLLVSFPSCKLPQKELFTPVMRVRLSAEGHSFSFCTSLPRFHPATPPPSPPPPLADWQYQPSHNRKRWTVNPGWSAARKMTNLCTMKTLQEDTPTHWQTPMHAHTNLASVHKCKTAAQSKPIKRLEMQYKVS